MIWILVGVRLCFWSWIGSQAIGWEVRPCGSCLSPEEWFEVMHSPEFRRAPYFKIEERKIIRRGDIAEETGKQ
jgi:hypothetical protein